MGHQGTGDMGHGIWDMGATDVAAGCRWTGLVVLGPPGDPKLEGCRHSMGPDAVLDALTLAQRFPGLRPGPGEVALWDSSGGVLLANRALQAVQVGADTGTEGWGHGWCSISTPPSLPPHTGRVSPARGHCARWGEGAAYRSRSSDHCHHHCWAVPRFPAHHRCRRMDQRRGGTSGPPPATAGKGWWPQVAVWPRARLT